MNRTLSNFGNQSSQLHPTDEGTEKLMHRETCPESTRQLMTGSGAGPRGVSPQ